MREFKRRFHGRVVNYDRFVKKYSQVRYALSYGLYQSVRRVLF
jgi:hypothetical protein